MLLRVARLACFLGVFLNVILGVLGAPFLERWIGIGFGDTQAQWILVWLAMAGVCQVLSTQMTLPFYQSINQMRFPVLVLIVEAVINLIASILLAPTFGPSGVAFATFVPAFFVSAAVLPWHLCRRFELTPATLARAVGVPSLVVGTAVGLTLVLLNFAFPSTAYSVLLLKGGIGGLLALVIFVLLFPHEDRQMAFGSVVAALPFLKRLLRT
jgi:O-antigen/teichoic acid export membrane protein